MAVSVLMRVGAFEGVIEGPGCGDLKRGVPPDSGGK